MTKRQREQVVELLRCAADLGSLFAACVYLGQVELEDRAKELTYRASREIEWPDGQEEFLLAAALVEEGTWP